MKSQKLIVKIQKKQRPEDEFEIGKKKYFTFLRFQLHVFRISMSHFHPIEYEGRKHIKQEKVKWP